LRPALAAIESGRYLDAVSELERGLARGGEHPALLHALGIAWYHLKDDRAVEVLRKAAAVRPRDPAIQNSLGNALAAWGQRQQALAAFDRAVAAAPRFGEAHFNRGQLLEAEGKPQPAISAFRAALDCNPAFSLGRVALARCYLSLDQPAIALLEAEPAVRALPDSSPAWDVYGRALAKLGRSEEAAQALARGLDSGDLASAGALASTLADQGRSEEGIAVLERSIRAAGPASLPETGSALLMLRQYVPADSHEPVARAHVEWGEKYASSPPGPSPDLSLEPGMPLRIAYLSPDFRTHSVGYFIEPLLEAHDRHRVHVTCYSDVERPDAATIRMRSLADVWHDTASQDHECFAGQVRAGRHHVVVELAGHTQGNRLVAMAGRLAPVQISYLGYPDTTGVPEMDYRITDRWVDPPGMTEGLHTEALLRVPPPFLCYRPPAEGPPVAMPAAHGADRVTFGSFNSPRKLNGAVVSVWARILREVSSATLYLKGGALGDPATRARLRARFSARGIDGERILLAGHAPTTGDHLACYADVDVALDTFPYGGTTTTCEAFWMGVPVVSLVGGWHSARVGYSLLNAVGLGHLAVFDEDAYVRAAVELARHRAYRLGLRASLRERLLDAPLTAADRLARALEDLYHETAARALERGAVGRGG